MAKVKLPPAPNNGKRRLRFPRLGLVKERLGATLMRLSPRTARQKWGRRRGLPWRIFGSRFSKPRSRTVQLAPVLGFQCEPPPGSRDVQQNIPYSRIRSVFGHLLAFGGAIPASFHTKHGSPRRDPLARF